MLIDTRAKSGYDKVQNNYDVTLSIRASKNNAENMNIEIN